MIMSREWNPAIALRILRLRPGLKKGQFYGAVFQDTDVAKWLEAVGYSLAEKKNEKLEKLADDAIDVIVQAQQEDGYLDTYFIIKEPSQRWRNLCEGHELYSAGHMIEAAVAYYEGTGKRKFLDSMIRLADLICRTFGPEEGQNHGYPGHQEIELALVRLYRVTQDKKYLEQAKYFLDIRGAGKIISSRSGSRRISKEFSRNLRIMILRIPSPMNR